MAKGRMLVTGQAPTSLKVAMVAADCLLIALAPVLVQLSKDKGGGYAYNPVAVNLLTELAKTTFAFGVLSVMGSDRPGAPLTRSARSFVRDCYHCRVLLAPAALYAINNYLKFVMQLFFKPTSAKMIGNLKVFVIALLMRSVLGRRFSTLQWEALFLLVAGITINQLSNCDHKQPLQMSPAAALVTLGSVTVPSMASVFNEYGFKRDMDTSVHVQNFFLYFFGLLVNTMGVFVSALLLRQGLWALFGSLNVWVWCLVAVNAAQGVLASFFYKFADTILKKYSSTLATIFTGVMSALLFGHHITANFCLGISIVLISMHQFFTDGERERKSVRDENKDGDDRGGVYASPSLEHVVDAALHSSASNGGRLTGRVTYELPR